MMINELDKYRDRGDFRLDELLEVANGFVELVAPEQPNDRVAERLNERTLRYYIAEGLVDRPVGKEGTAALYGYRHLAQILALKRLQVSYLPIKRIKEILTGRSDEELKAIVEGKRQEPEYDIRQDARDYLDSLLPESPSRVCANLVSPPQKKDRQPPSKMSYGPPSPVTPKESTVPSSGAWERFALDEGVEIHVRLDRLKTLRGAEAKKIADRILNLLKHRNDREKRR